MTVSKVNKISVDITYPVARKSLHSGLVVLFTSEQRGLVLVGNSDYDVGNWATGWAYAYDTEAWEAVEVTIDG